MHIPPFIHLTTAIAQRGALPGFLFDSEIQNLITIARENQNLKVSNFDRKTPFENSTHSTLTRHATQRP
jgi:hypothetical protein